MKRISGFLSVLLLAGCVLFDSPSKVFVEGVEKSSSVILEEYEKYVVRREPLPAIRPGEEETRWRKIRQDSVDAFRALIREAKKEQ